MKKINEKYFVFAGEFLLILVFLYTGIYKIIHFNGWIKKVSEIDIVNEYNLIWLAYLIPFLEIILVVLFCFSTTKKIATYLSSFLMAFFTAYIYYKIYISEDSLCPCGGIFSSLTLDKHLIVNIVLFSISILLIIKQKNETNC